MTFRPLDGPWPYAHDAIAHVEEWNCSRGRGCQHGARPGSSEWTELGPGGSCGLLAAIAVGADDPIEEMTMDGGAGYVVCWEYTQRPVPPIAPPVPVGDGQLELG